MITIYLPVFIFVKYSKTDFLLYQIYKEKLTRYYWHTDGVLVGRGKTKFLAILDYLRRGLR